MVIRVLIATAVRAYRHGLQRVLQGAEGIALVGIASTAEQVVEQSCKLLPSVILLDNAMAKCLALAPDLLGFRSALCRNGDRTQTLDAERLAAVRVLIPERPRLLAEPHMADLAPQALC